MISFLVRLPNVVDLLCILPYWIQFGTGSSQAQGAVFLRVIRILRVFKIMKFSKRPQQLLSLILKTMLRSMPALAVLSMLLVLLIIFFGFIIFYAESGKYQVTADFPSGAYLRTTMNGQGLEVSPFVSVPTSIYWVVTTGTTGSREYAE